MVKNIHLPAQQMWETRVQPLGQEDPGRIFLPREGRGNPLQYFCLGNPMDRGVAWWATVQGLSKSQIQLSD